MDKHSIACQVLKRCHPASFLSSPLVIALMCAFLLSACGGTPIEHPLITGTPTNDIGTSTLSNRGGVAPIQVVSAQTNLTAYPGGSMTLTVTTSPFAVCNLEISYGHSKPGQIPGAGAVTASSTGTASWNWTVEQNAHVGTWPLTITANLANGAKTQTQINVSVIFPPLGLVSSSSKLTAHPGGLLRVAVQTIPFMTCEVVYAFGVGRPAKSVTGKAGSRGLATLDWFAGTDVPKGIYPVTISELLADGEQTSIQTNVTIF